MILQFIGFFGGFLLSNVIDTTLGEFNEWAIVGAALVVASLELISKGFYFMNRTVRKKIRTKSYTLNLLNILNTLKIGIIYGLLVDAFKLGS
jgi:hypothetical protein|tara:strand:- start:947 stop:1222 length:276 start_codon:yes stop_codon:yes gene_type:complete